MSDLETDVIQAELTVLSASGALLAFAVDPVARDMLHAKDIGKAIEQLQDVLVLKSRREAA
jgi:hypothetical protein